MLIFEREVKAADSNVAVYVFTDPEKGHTVYLSHPGMLSVVEADRASGARIRAAGFAISGSDCSSCNGC